MPLLTEGQARAPYQLLKKLRVDRLQESSVPFLPHPPGKEKKKEIKEENEIDQKMFRRNYI